MAMGCSFFNSRIYLHQNFSASQRMKLVSAMLLVLHLLLFAPAHTLASEAVWPHSSRVSQLIKQGDAWFARRAEGGVDDRALPGPILRATELYQSALQIARKPEDRKMARLKLLEALYFRSCYATPQDNQKLKLFAKGMELSLQFQRSWPADPAGYYFYALFISLWAEEKGIITAIKEGVATKVRNAALKVIDLDPKYRSGGPWKMLAVLYHVSPQIPFLTPWASSDSAEVYLEKALRMNPHDPPANYFMARLLAETNREEQAIQWTAKIINRPLRPEQLMEDHRILWKTVELRHKLLGWE